MWFGAHLTVFTNSSWNLPKYISNPVQLKVHSISLDNIKISKLETKVNYYLGFQLIVPRVGWEEEDSSPSSLNCGPISDHNVPFSTPFSDLPSKIPTCLQTELIWKWLYSVCIFPLPCPRELGIFIFLRILVVTVVVTLKIISGTNTFIHSCDYIENHTPLNGQNLYPFSVRDSLYKANV